MTADGNLFASPPAGLVGEEAVALATSGGARVERIVSAPGYSSPDGFWYDQPHSEWVAVLSGSAGLLFADEREPRRLGPGDYVFIPAHTRHRVAWTDAAAPTIWLAVHFPEGK